MDQQVGLSDEEMSHLESAHAAPDAGLTDVQMAAMEKASPKGVSNEEEGLTDDQLTALEAVHAAQGQPVAAGGQGSAAPIPQGDGASVAASGQGQSSGESGAQAQSGQAGQVAARMAGALPIIGGVAGPVAGYLANKLNSTQAPEGMENGALPATIAAGTGFIGKAWQAADQDPLTHELVMKPLQDTWDALKSPGSAAVTAFSVPQGLIAGNAARVINPSLMDVMRRRDIAEDTPMWKRKLHEIAPPIYLGADVLKPYLQKQAQELGVVKGTILDSIVHDLTTAAALATDVETDPLMYVKFLQPARAFEEAKAAGTAKEIINGEEVYKAALPNGQEAYVTRNKLFLTDPTGTVAPGATIPKDLVQIRPPGFSKPLIAIEGKDVQQWAQIKQAQLTNTWMGKGLTYFNNATNNQAFNEMRHVESVETGASRVLVGNIDQDFNLLTGGKKLSQDQSQYAYLLSQLGQEGADKVASFKGIALNVEEKALASEVGKRMEQWRTSTAEMAGKMSGNPVEMFMPALAEEKATLMGAMSPAEKATYAQLPDEVKPYIFSDNANLHRMRNPEFVKQARQLGLDIGEAEKANQIVHDGVNFPTVANSSKQRSKFSSWFVDYSKEVEFAGTGINEPFYNPDVLVATKTDSENMLRAASNQKFLAGAKTLGATASEWQAKISAAQEMMANGVRDPEIARVAGLDIKSLQEVDVDKLNPWKFAGTGQGGAAKLVQAPLLFEPDVAMGLNNHFGVVNVNNFNSFVGQVNSIVSRNYLSSPTRILPMGLGEGLLSYVGAGGKPKAFIQAVMSSVKPDKLSAIFHSSGIEIDVNKALDVVKKAIVTPGMYNLAEGAEGISAPMRMLSGAKKFAMESWQEAAETVQDAVRSKGKTMGIVDASGTLTKDGAKWFVNNVVDNPLNRKTRDWVNGMQSVAKEALFRQKISEGMNEYEALKFTGDRMMDFRFQPNNNATAYFTFGNFHYQNAKRLGFLVTDNPWIVNLTRSDRNTIKAAFEDDWDPEAASFLHKAYKMSGETVFGGIIAGSKSLMRNPQMGQGVLNQYLGALLNKLPEDSLAGQALQNTKEGFQVQHYLPTALGATQHIFGDPELGVLSPAIRAGMILAGYDVGTGKKLINWPQQYEALTRSTNPMANPNFWNITNAFMDEAQKAHIKNMNMIFSDEAYDKIVRAGGGATAQKVWDESKPGQKQLASIASTVTLGLFKLSSPDIINRMNSSAIEKEINDAKYQVKQYAALKAGPERDKQIREGNELVVEKNNEYTKLWDRYHAYKRATQALQLSPFGPMLVPSGSPYIPKEDK